MSISRRDGDFVISLINMILYLAFQPATGPIAPRHANVIAQMPQSIRDAVSKFDLESQTVIYAACPKCHCTYKPRYNSGSTRPIYDNTCTNQPTPDSDPCGEPLLRRMDEDGHRVMKPIKPYVYHDFHDYLASLLSHADLEEAMDKSCDDLMRTVNDPMPEHVTDIWEAEFLRTFEGPSGKTLFIDRQGEGRYGFTLNIDFFNIEGMKVRGASTSCGIVSMVCLNLPFEIRYNPENIFIAGIIPGPRQPSLTDLNHYVKPLIDDLVVSWDQGVRYSRTALHSTGRTTHSAIIAAVMDLPAARHASQLASHGSHFYCTVCQHFH
jgi:Transposase family tnp2